MKRIFVYALQGLLPIVTAHLSAQAQNGFYISPGTTVTVSAGNTVSFDSLVLIPSADLSITGQNSVSKNTALTNAASNTYISRVFLSGALISSFSGDIRIYYQDNELNGLDENSLTLNVYNGTGWGDYSSGVTRNAVSNFVQTTVSNLDLKELTLAAFTAPLPLIWIKTRAYQSSSNNIVEWVTAEEKDIWQYQVQRSTDAISWKNTGAPVSGRNTAGPNYYSYRDALAVSGVVYYRIQQKDIDGSITYSEIMPVTGSSVAQKGIMLYPNPVRTDLYFETTDSRVGFTEINIYNTSGIIVKRITTSTFSYTLDTGTLPKGTYTAVITMADNTVVTRSFIKL